MGFERDRLADVAAASVSASAVCWAAESGAAEVTSAETSPRARAHRPLKSKDHLRQGEEPAVTGDGLDELVDEIAGPALCRGWSG